MFPHLSVCLSVVEIVRIPLKQKLFCSRFSTLQMKYKEVKARNSQLLKMLQQGESELNISDIRLLSFLLSP